MKLTLAKKDKSMTISQILEYLNNENVAKSASSRMTRIYFSNGMMAVAHFYKKDQEQSLVLENTWKMFLADHPDSPIVFSGEEIDSLKSGAPHEI